MNIASCSCNFDLGKVYPLFRAISQDILKQLKDNPIADFSRENILYDNNTVNFKFILDELDIKNECCRMHMLTIYSKEIHDDLI